MSFFIQQDEVRLPKAKIHKPTQPKGEFMWNKEKIKKTLNNLAKEIHELKALIRQPNVKITSDQHYSLTRLQSMVTLLCVIRASSRNRVHLAFQNVICENCHPCEASPYSGLPNHTTTVIKCSHQGLVSQLGDAWTCWQCKKCMQYFTTLRPMTLALQNDWLTRNLSESVKATYSKQEVKV